MANKAFNQDDSPKPFVEINDRRTSMPIKNKYNKIRKERKRKQESKHERKKEKKANPSICNAASLCNHDLLTATAGLDMIMNIIRVVIKAHRLLALIARSSPPPSPPSEPAPVASTRFPQETFARRTTRRTFRRQKPRRSGLITDSLRITD